MFPAQAPTRSPPPPPRSRLYLPGRARAAREPEYRGLLMFPDWPAQPANIPRARYPCSRAAVEEASAPARAAGAAVNPWRRNGRRPLRRILPAGRSIRPRGAPLPEAPSQPARRRALGFRVTRDAAGSLGLGPAVQTPCPVCSRRRKRRRARQGAREGSGGARGVSLLLGCSSELRAPGKPLWCRLAGPPGPSCGGQGRASVRFPGRAPRR